MALAIRQITRECGTALAVLALYLLVLLAPLHQAAGLQRDLEKLGFETASSWSVCAPLVQDENGDPTGSAIVKCPAAGIAKHDFLAVLPSAPLFLAPAAVAAPYPVAAASHGHPALPEHFGQSRAPPATV